MKNLKRILHEAIKLDVEKGDVILTGRFKNKRKIVKTIGTDRFGQPTINGKSILKFKIEKHMPKNKMSAKTREEMNEMNNLRKAIRRLILENQSHFDKMMEMIGSEKIDNINQVFELAAGMGYVEKYEYKFKLGKVSFNHIWKVSGNYDPDFLQALFMKNRFLSHWCSVTKTADGFEFMLKESSYASDNQVV
tara:strand:+ start:617 stop:1192 length:576 start_codon:yes stop_codon:yes gene_type:complete